MQKKKNVRTKKAIPNINSCVSYFKLKKKICYPNTTWPDLKVPSEKQNCDLRTIITNYCINVINNGYFVLFKHFLCLLIIFFTFYNMNWITNIEIFSWFTWIMVFCVGRCLLAQNCLFISHPCITSKFTNLTTKLKLKNKLKTKNISKNIFSLC